MIAAYLCLIVAGIGVLATWPGRPGTDSWWIGPGTRDSRGGRIRMAVADALMVSGLVGAIVVQLFAVSFGMAEVLLVGAQLVLLGFTIGFVVRHWRPRADASH
jgi:hypothetical protein